MLRLRAILRGVGNGHSHAGHSHAVSGDADARRLGWALALILAFMAGEVTAGIVADSLALLSDAAHMLTDAVAIALALVAMRLARRPAEGGFTYGMKRAEILSAAVNGASLLVLGVLIVIEGVHRSMVEAGAEVVETDTFQASRIKLGEWGLADHTVEINQRYALADAARAHTDLESGRSVGSSVLTV